MNLHRVIAHIALAGLALAGCHGSPAKPVHHSPAVQATHRGPNAQEQAELALAQRNGGVCHLEWDGPAYAGYEAICAAPARRSVPTKAMIACAKVPSQAKKDCVALYRRPARTVKNADGSSYSDPAGPALVQECTSQYSGSELVDCIRQPE